MPEMVTPTTLIGLHVLAFCGTCFGAGGATGRYRIRLVKGVGGCELLLLLLVLRGIL